VARNEKPDNM